MKKDSIFDQFWNGTDIVSDNPFLDLLVIIIIDILILYWMYKSRKQKEVVE
jgi:hypothetical protein